MRSRSPDSAKPRLPIAALRLVRGVLAQQTSFLRGGSPRRQREEKNGAMRPVHANPARDVGEGRPGVKGGVAGDTKVGGLVGDGRNEEEESKGRLVCESERNRRSLRPP